ncbi:MAG TPA: hypothetical protein VFZ61_05005, partial [Polyangiales bacterium]
LSSDCTTRHATDRTEVRSGPGGARRGGGWVRAQAAPTKVQSSTRFRRVVTSIRRRSHGR